MHCRDFRELADSYLSGELLVETNHEVISHLEVCGDCRRELESRRELRSTLRTAFTNSPELQINDQFARRLRSQLHSAALQEPAVFFTRSRVWWALAASLVVVVALGVIALRYRAHKDELSAATGNKPGGTKSTRPTPQKSRITELANYAVDDHRDCAISFRLPARPISLEEAGRLYDRAYANLTEAVQNPLAGTSTTLVEAHSCVIKGRRFAHLVFKQNNHLVSLLITDLEGLEAASTQQAGGAEIRKDQQVISCSEVQGYRVSCFQTAGHAVFVVSDLSEADNLTLARSLAPGIYQHFARFENLARLTTQL